VVSTSLWSTAAWEDGQTCVGAGKPEVLYVTVDAVDILVESYASPVDILWLE
jgi:hypothetical protein